LNKVTIEIKYPFPRIDHLFAQLKGENIFSKIDMTLAYHQVKIKEEYISKTSIRTRYKHYEFMVVPIGLTNETTKFLCQMNGVFIYFLENKFIVFLEDIIIYFKTKENHE
jgi:hypothetical protein